jgi:tRNA threonylcarbamoyladenosine biosynthesis protein TsaE
VFDGDTEALRMVTFQSQSESETERLGEALGRRLERGLCVCLVGPLGSGKSVIARGICRGLGIREPVVSPTFVLCEAYEGRVPVLHLDLYRLDHENQIAELGVLDRAADVVVLAEWGDRSPYLLERADMIVRFEVTGPSERVIRIEAADNAASLLEGGLDV